jgi:hypothetical protein
MRSNFMQQKDVPGADKNHVSFGDLLASSTPLCTLIDPSIKSHQAWQFYAACKIQQASKVVTSRTDHEFGKY